MALHRVIALIDNLLERVGPRHLSANGRGCDQSRHGSRGGEQRRGGGRTCRGCGSTGDSAVEGTDDRRMPVAKSIDGETAVAWTIRGELACGDGRRIGGMVSRRT